MRVGWRPPTRPCIRRCATSSTQSSRCPDPALKKLTSKCSRAIKKLSEMIEVMVTHFAQGRPLRYFCTGESRWGLKTLTGRVITLRASNLWRYCNGLGKRFGSTERSSRLQVHTSSTASRISMPCASTALLRSLQQPFQRA